MQCEEHTIGVGVGVGVGEGDGEGDEPHPGFPGIGVSPFAQAVQLTSVHLKQSLPKAEEQRTQLKAASKYFPMAHVTHAAGSEGALQVRQLAAQGSQRLTEFSAKPPLQRSQIEVVTQFKQFASDGQAPEPTSGCFFFLMIIYLALLYNFIP